MVQISECPLCFPRDYVNIHNLVVFIPSFGCYLHIMIKNNLLYVCDMFWHSSFISLDHRFKEHNSLKKNLPSSRKKKPIKLQGRKEPSQNLVSDLELT